MFVNQLRKILINLHLPDCLTLVFTCLYSIVIRFFIHDKYSSVGSLAWFSVSFVNFDVLKLSSILIAKAKVCLKRYLRETFC